MLEREKEYSQNRLNLQRKDGNADSELRSEDKSVNKKTRIANRGQESIRTNGRGITTEFVNNKRIDFRGKQLSQDNGVAAEELAIASMILRDPRFETFRMIYTKGNKIVATDAVTTYSVISSKVFKPKNKNDNTIKNHLNRMKRLGADGY